MRATPPTSRPGASGGPTHWVRSSTSISHWAAEELGAPLLIPRPECRSGGPASLDTVWRIMRAHGRMPVPMSFMVVAASLLIIVLANGDAGAHVKDTSVRPALTESVHTTYLSCTSGAVLTASIRQPSYSPGQNIVVTMRLKNVTSKPCDYPNQPPPSGGPPTSSLAIGGCNGAASFAVDTSRGQLVYANPPAPLAAHSYLCCRPGRRCRD